MQSLIAPDHLREIALTAAETPPGDFVEVGVYQGGSAEHLYRVACEQGRRLFLFDTFTGIPYSDPARGDRHVVGDFSDVDLSTIREALPEAQFRVGLFPDTLDDDVGPIAFAHIDCDQYQSVRACCVELGPRMVAGGVMWFDDPDVLEGAARAVRDSFPPERIQRSGGGKWLVRF